MMKSLAGLRQPRHRDGSCGGCGGGDRPVHLLLWTLLYDDKVSAASPLSWHEAPTRLLDCPGARQDQVFFDFCGLPCLSKWLGHDNPTASQVKLFT